ncbi:MAG: GlsB/YeaQ/YmgE family stress response membrane protein [Acidimicrobiia bacterium]
MLILAIIATGMAIGAVAQLILGRAGTRIDWTMALVAGLGGSFVGGLLFSLIAGDGLDIRPSGLIGSLIGALVVTGLWIRFDPQKRDEAKLDHRR